MRAMNGTCLFLGTGSSIGVPVVGCKCAVCMSNDPRNKRLRPALFLTVNGRRILVDAGTDLRTQLLRADIDDLDGVILTHGHADHLNGIDDLRPFFFFHHKAMPVLLSQETLHEFQARFPYFFDKRHASLFSLEVLPSDFGSTQFCGIDIQYFSYSQAGMKVTGIKIGKFAYVTDIREYDPSIIDHLQGVDTLVLSALREKPTVSHFSIEEAIAFAKETGAKKVYFSHIAHELDHESTQKSLPAGFFLSYDGLNIPIT